MDPRTELRIWLFFLNCDKILDFSYFVNVLLGFGDGKSVRLE